MAYLNDPQTPDIIKPEIAAHIQATIQLAKQQMAQKLAMQQAGIGPMQPGAQQTQQGMMPQQQGPQQPPQGAGIRQPMVGNRPKMGQGMPINNRPVAGGMPGNGLPQ